jgi:hypothetical protein
MRLGKEGEAVAAFLRNQLTLNGDGPDHRRVFDDADDLHGAFAL